MTDSDVIFANRDVAVRVATEADNAALCDVVRRVHLRSKLDVTQERDPDFFALPRMHHGDAAVYVAENPDGFVGGCGTVVTRPGWVDGRQTTVGYLSDLRAVPGFRGARVLPKAYHAALERAREEHGAEVFYTVIFDDNELAKRALLGFRKRERKGQPVYREMTPFNMTSVQFFLPCRKPRNKVRRASAEDLDRLHAFLERKSRLRTMGEVLTSERFARRLDEWPDFSIESFWLALDRDGDIVGTLAPWNTHSFKRTRVLGYYDEMLRTKRLFNLGAPVLGYPPLPEPGKCLDFCWLSHLEIERDDPYILKDLLRAVYREHRKERLHFLSAMIPRGSPLEHAFKGFVVNRTPMTVYSVTLPSSAYAGRELTTSSPGFEMALS